MEFLKSLNWIDLLVVVVAVRIVYIGVKTGFVTEFMKILGVLTATFVVFHSYTKIASILVPFAKIPLSLLEVIVFLGLWALIFGIFKFIRDGLFLVFTVQAISAVDRGGAAVIALVRFALTASLLMFALLLADKAYLERIVIKSFTQKHILLVAPDAYQKMTNGFVAKLFVKQKVNPAVIEELHEAGKK